MATIYTAINMTAFNRKQVGKACASLGILRDNSDSTPALVAKVKAK